jgi:long-subunit acyl-CoA synthetase (AMP-forming)
MFRVTGRYKELLIGAGGENIAPVPIEDSIRGLCSKIVSNVMVVGDKMPFNCALITLKANGATGEVPGDDKLDAEALAFAVSKGSDVTSISGSMSPDSPFVAEITRAIEATNNDEVACSLNAAKVQKFMILPCDFSVETDELTPTFKLKRSLVHEKYADAIDKMYSSKEKYFQYPL